MEEKVVDFLQLFQQQDVQGLKSLVVFNPDFIRNNFTGSRSKPLLSLAVEFGNLALVELLLEYGACTEQRDSRGRLPLYTAATTGNIEILQALINGKASLDAKYITGNTAFQGAIVKRQFEASEFLIKAGCDVNAVNNVGETALHLAAEKDATGVAELLLNSGFDCNVVKSRIEHRRHHGFGITPLHIAAHFNHVSIVNSLLAHGADIDKPTENGVTALHVACRQSSRASLETLLDHGADLDAICEPDTQPTTALMIAIGKHDTLHVQALISAGADVNKSNNRGVSPLVKAVWEKIPKNLFLLLENGVDLSSCVEFDELIGINKISPIIAAVNCGNLMAFDILIKAGYKVSGREKEMLTTRPSGAEIHWAFTLLTDPLSLLNSCRRMIRNRVAQTCGGSKFRNSIHRLPLPEILKKFLLCHDLFTS